MSASTELGSPWYQNFWPWFIVVLLGISIAASLMTVRIAFVHRDVEIDRSVRATTPSSQEDHGR